MLEIKDPFSIWIQVSSFSFFLAGNFSDLLIIRICLSSAYVFLFLNSILGAPLWPSFRSPNKIQLDGACWACLNLYVHVSTVVRLLKDEFQVNLSEDEQALWRMFYRTGGLSKKMFQTNVAKYCQVVKHLKDEKIDTDNYFYIVYKGIVKLTVTDEHHGTIVSSRKAQSGQLFDFRALGLLVDHRSLVKHKLEAVVAVSDVKLFRFPKEQMPMIASEPSTRLMWKELLMENLLRIVQGYFGRRMRSNPAVVDYVHPIFCPLEPWEEPDPLRAGSGYAMMNPFSHVWASMKWSFASPWPFQGPPQGLRHTQLLAPGRISGIPPRKLLDRDETDSLLSVGSSLMSNANNSTSYDSFASEEDHNLIDYVHEIDEEMGGMNLVGFKRAVSFKLEEDSSQRSEV
jgi:CRP-like cAMP-binding protein